MHSPVVRLVFLSSFLSRLKRDLGVVQYPWFIGLSTRLQPSSVQYDELGPWPKKMIEAVKKRQLIIST